MIVNTLTLEDSNFPEELGRIFDPPKAIYWQGSELSSFSDKPKLAVVGSRKMSPYGRQICHQLVDAVARRGVVIVSGLAFGIDALAHQATLEASGQTIAVLPGSLKNIYPRSHEKLANKIVQQGGTLMTEYEKGNTIMKHQFIARNRLISALSDAVLIPEAALNSGSLHTARFALEQGKTVLTVPGNITSPLSEGCNNLIKAGAIAVTEPEDVILALGLPLEPSEKAEPLVATELEKQIITLIKQGINELDLITDALNVSIAECSAAITMLEINGHITPLGNAKWALR